MSGILSARFYPFYTLVNVFAKSYLHHISGKRKHDAKPGVHDADHRRVVAHCAGVYEAGWPKQKLEKDIVPVSRKSRNIPSQTTRHDRHLILLRNPMKFDGVVLARPCRTVCSNVIGTEIPAKKVVLESPDRTFTPRWSLAEFANRREGVINKTRIRTGTFELRAHDKSDWQ